MGVSVFRASLIASVVLPQAVKLHAITAVIARFRSVFMFPPYVCGFDRVVMIRHNSVSQFEGSSLTVSS